MNVKTKAFGLIAGAGLALSLTSGVIAQTESVTVTLQADQNAVGCAASGLDGTAFGLVDYDGGTGTYEAATATLGFTLSAEPTGPSDTPTCNVQVSGTDFTNGDTTTPVTFGVGALGFNTTAASPPYTGVTNADQALYTGTGTGSKTVNLQLDLGEDTPPLDDYTSTLTFTVADA